MQMPPRSAIASRRAATLTPLPNMSPASLMMSPTLMPMRNSIRFSGGTSALHRVYRACELHQHAVASRLDDVSSALLYLGIAKLAAMLFQLSKRALLVI